ncbi:MAG: DUF3109 family protein [Chitinophagaceae bacterium]|nr:DUF3109 family protein [Chitinophagaceae bacterium]
MGFCMLIIDNILVSEEVVQQKFVCDLAACRGACCEEGDAGAPLEDEELPLIATYYKTVKPLLSESSIKVIKEKGTALYHEEFGWVTPTLPDDRELCVYALRNLSGVIECAFEKAYYSGLIPWKKPLSCHLFPIIVEKGKSGLPDRMNYEPREKICRPACSSGKKQNIFLFEFLKEAIIRKFGKEFYDALKEAAGRFMKNENAKYEGNPT